MMIPKSLRPILDALAPIGRPLLIGGCVRDWMLGGAPKDYDIEVFGTNYRELGKVLRRFGGTDIVGESFGTIKLRAEGYEYDFSLPRRESKTGKGHRGFAIEVVPDLTPEEAAARRDFTVNAIAFDPFTSATIDPHGGEKDLRKGLLRHTSAAFVEDPLRVLRAFQFAARFEFTVAPETISLCRSIVDQYQELPVERVWHEWDKWATKSKKPSSGLQVLEDTGWLLHFPEVASLRNTPQEPEWHPEGDVFTHTQHCVDALISLPEWQTSAPERRRILTFAVLAHDFGKPSTTSRAERRGVVRWISPGHEAAGGQPTEAFLQRIGAPLSLVTSVRPLVVNHLAHHHGQEEFTDSSVRRLARKLTPATIEDLSAVMLADHYGRPPLISRETLSRIEELRTKATALKLEDVAPKPIILGRHLVTLGLTPGPEYKSILDASFEAQLDGAFTDESTGMLFLEKYLRARGGSGN